MAQIIYLLCATTAGGCAWLLFRSFALNGRRLLLWSAACFATLALGNALLIIDQSLLAKFDFLMLRLIVTFAAVLALLVGLIFEEH